MYLFKDNPLKNETYFMSINSPPERALKNKHKNSPDTQFKIVGKSSQKPQDYSNHSGCWRNGHKV